MRCPYCDTPMTIPDVVRTNVSTYHRDQTIPTPCCGKGVVVSRVEMVRVRASVGPERQDNWGEKIKPSKREEVINHDAQYN